MTFYLLCTKVFGELFNRMLRASVIPDDRSCLGKTNLEGVFAGVIVWTLKDGKTERKCKIAVKYVTADGRRKPCGVTVTFMDQEPREFTTFEQLDLAATTEWFDACIKM